MACTHPQRERRSAVGARRPFGRSTRFVLLAIALACFVLWPSAARATAIPFPRAEDGDGIKVGERSTFHAGFALATGVDTNVFYEAKEEDPQAAAYLLPTAWLGIGNRVVRGGVLNMPPERSSRILDYNIYAVGGFRQYLSGQESVRRQSRFSIGGVIRLAFLPGRRFSILFDEDIFRLADPANLDAGAEFNFNRIDHRGRLSFIGRPGGGRLSLLVGFRNELLWFEGDELTLTRNNRMVNGLFHETKWRFFPKSALVFNYSFDHTYYISCCAETGRGRNEDNYAHRIQGGYRGQFREKFTISALAGWGYGYYRDDSDGPDFNSFIGDVSFTYYPTLRSYVTVSGYRAFADSLLGNYFVDNGARLGGGHEFRWRMIARLGFGVAGRTYHGLPRPGSGDAAIDSYEGRNAPALQRKDTLVMVDAKLEQPLGRIWALALGYNLLIDAADFRTQFVQPMPFLDHAGFVKHWVMLFGAVRI